MATRMEPPELPLIVIVGPTASGKTTLAIQLAEELGGEIICADSRTVYRGMDIGTAKPSVEERARVPHWGLDLVEPGERFTSADFKQYAINAIQEIRSHGQIPFLVGGTGLYVDAVLFDYQFGNPGDSTRRAELERMSIKALREYCIKNNIMLPENEHNKRYIIRAIEQNGINQQRRRIPINQSIIVGIATDKKQLRTRIGHRAEQLLNNGVVEEAIILGKKYDWDSEAMTGNIYPLIHDYTKKICSLEEVKERFVALDWKLAKRQLTWFRRNPHIVWMTQEQVIPHIKSIFAAK